MLGRFAKEETGAVAVDWVVLSASVVGLGMASVMVVSGGLESLSGEIAADTAGIEISTRFARTLETLSLAQDFANGVGDWIGGNAVALAGFGEVLQIGPGSTAELPISIPEGTTSATITFDLIGVDDLSGPPATIFIDGEAIAVYSDNHGNITTSENAPAGITVSMTQHYANDPMGGGSHGSDSRATYTITVDNPGRDLTFGVQNGSSQPVSEEFYALDDISVTTR
jgi:hypothetical protein